MPDSGSRFGALAALGLVTAVAASGCGGGGEEEPMTKADYQAEILAVLEDSTEPSGLYTDLVVEPLPRQQCADGVASLEDQVGDLIDRVAALRPPAEVEVAHDDFIAAARTSVNRIGTVREEVAQGNVSCGDELNRELYGMPSTEEAERAIARLERRGYFVFGE